MSETPPPAVLIGVRRVRGTRADLELELDPDRPATAPVGLTEVAVLADLALGGALRARLGATRVLPTVSLTLHLAAHLASARLPPGVRVRAWGDGPADGLADARAEVVAGDRLVGRALATFAVPDPPSCAPPLPWEVDAGEVPLRNRAGHVQGGVLFGLAAAGAGPAPGRTVSGHVLFVAPASADAAVRTVATPVRTTRRTRFVRSDLHQGGQVVATAMFTFRAADPRRGAAGRARGAGPAR